MEFEDNTQKTIVKIGKMYINIAQKEFFSVKTSND